MLSIVFFLNSIEEKAQNSSPQKISCDCSDAIKININNTLGEYYNYPTDSKIKNINIKDMLCHQAGLPAWIPFYKNTLDSLGNPDALWYSKVKDDSFSVKILDSLYLKKSF
ncbi:MAG TPA: hypothetical protein PLL00_16065, partial [Bacteroidia bacterium]|nr:hypothetical protein [Bacteroidia bacterium]